MTDRSSAATDRATDPPTVRAFVVTVPACDVDVASDRLWQQGVRAIEERTGETDEYVELWTSVGRDDRAVSSAVSILDVDWTWRVVDVPAAATTWREYAQVTDISETLQLVPAWIEHTDRAGVLAVLVEPGAAFGLGDHPTTRLSAALVESAVAARVRLGSAPTMLDVGCGSGVLSIVAARSGASAVRAIDISGDAVDATVDNAQANGVGHLIHVDTAPFTEVPGPYDIVVANILAPVLIAAAGDLRRLTASGGSLIVSGVLAGAHAHVVAALAPMVVTETRTMDGWAALVLEGDAGRQRDRI